MACSSSGRQAQALGTSRPAVAQHRSVLSAAAVPSSLRPLSRGWSAQAPFDGASSARAQLICRSRGQNDQAKASAVYVRDNDLSTSDESLISERASRVAGTNWPSAYDADVLDSMPESLVPEASRAAASHDDDDMLEQRRQSNGDASSSASGSSSLRASGQAKNGNGRSNGVGKLTDAESASKATASQQPLVPPTPQGSLQRPTNGNGIIRTGSEAPAQPSPQPSPQLSAQPQRSAPPPSPPGAEALLLQDGSASSAGAFLLDRLWEDGVRAPLAEAQQPPHPSPNSKQRLRRALAQANPPPASLLLHDDGPQSQLLASSLQATLRVGGRAPAPRRGKQRAADEGSEREVFESLSLEQLLHDMEQPQEQQQQAQQGAAAADAASKHGSLANSDAPPSSRSSSSKAKGGRGRSEPRQRQQQQPLAKQIWRAPDWLQIRALYARDGARFGAPEVVTALKRLSKVDASKELGLREERLAFSRLWDTLCSRLWYLAPDLTGPQAADAIMALSRRRDAGKPQLVLDVMRYSMQHMYVAPSSMISSASGGGYGSYAASGGSMMGSGMLLASASMSSMTSYASMSSMASYDGGDDPMPAEGRSHGAPGDSGSSGSGFGAALGSMEWRGSGGGGGGMGGSDGSGGGGGMVQMSNPNADWYAGPDAGFASPQRSVQQAAAAAAAQLGFGRGSAWGAGGAAASQRMRPLDFSKTLFHFANLHEEARLRGRGRLFAPPAWRERFWSATLPLLQLFSPGDFANVLSGAATMQLRPPAAWLQEAYSASGAQLPNMSTQELSMVLYSVSRMPLRPPTSWLEAALTLSARRFEDDFDAPAYAMLAHSLGRLRYKPSRQWALAFLESSFDLLYDFRPEEMSLFMRGIAFLGICPDDEWLEELFEQSEARLGQFSPPQAANLAWAIAKLKLCPPRKWVGTYLTLLDKHRHELSPYHTKRVLGALYTFGVKDFPGWCARLGMSSEQALAPGSAPYHALRDPSPSVSIAVAGVVGASPGAGFGAGFGSGAGGGGGTADPAAEQAAARSSFANGNGGAGSLGSDSAAIEAGSRMGMGSRLAAEEARPSSVSQVLPGRYSAAAGDAAVTPTQGGATGSVGGMSGGGNMSSSRSSVRSGPLKTKQQARAERQQAEAQLLWAARVARRRQALMLRTASSAADAAAAALDAASSAASDPASAVAAAANDAAAEAAAAAAPPPPAVVSVPVLVPVSTDPVGFSDVAHTAADGGAADAVHAYAVDREAGEGVGELWEQYDEEGVHEVEEVDEGAREEARLLAAQQEAEAYLLARAQQRKRQQQQRLARARAAVRGMRGSGSGSSRGSVSGSGDGAGPSARVQLR